jgi:outer membrane protein OmpA-like peptidoglycan-associated protein
VGSSVISQTGKTAIKKFVSKSGKDAKYTVTGVATKVAGVSDSRVKGLAKARAEKVKAYLIKLGVKKSNISIKVKIVESGITPKTAILAKYSVL